MNIEPVTNVTLRGVEATHSALNAAFNALALDRESDDLSTDTALARGYVSEARTYLVAGHGNDGQDDALTAARFILPRLDRALQLLDELEVTKDAMHITPLLDEIGIAMDHVEQTLTAAGYDL